MNRGGANTSVRIRLGRSRLSNKARTRGFTIVEVMIVLAVTGAMFLMAVVLISGRQARTEFQVGVRTVQTQLQKVITEAKAGYYPTQANFTCTVTISTDPLSIATSAAGNAQGSHDSCIFIGKALVLSGDKLYVYSLAGARKSSTGADVTTPQEAQVTAIAPADSTQVGIVPDATVGITMPSGITLVKASDNGTLAPHTTFGVAVLSSLNSVVSAGGASSGVQTFGLHSINTAHLPSEPNQIDIAKVINDQLGVTPPYPSISQAKFCLQSGTTDQSVILTIGSDVNGQGTAVSSAIKNGTTCG